MILPGRDPWYTGDRWDIRNSSQLQRQTHNRNRPDSNESFLNKTFLFAEPKINFQKLKIF